MKYTREISFQKAHAEAKNIAEQLHVKPFLPRLAKRSCPRSIAGAVKDVESHFRMNVFYLARKAVLQDLKFNFERHLRQAFHLLLPLPIQYAKNCTLPADEKKIVREGNVCTV